MVRILGPAALEVGGAGVELGGPQRRSVLAALAARANTPCSIDWLSDVLWADDPPAAAVASIHAQVSRLRRVLEPERAPRAEATILVSTRAGYQLVLDGGSLDADLFGRSVVRSRSLDAPARVAELMTALKLWRGPALIEVADTHALGGDAAALEDARSEATELLLSTFYDLGRFSEVVADAERLCGEKPEREAAWIILMKGLFARGRTADALEAYQRGRRALADLGLEPGPMMRETEAAILRQELEIPVAAIAVSGAMTTSVVVIEVLDPPAETASAAQRDIRIGAVRACVAAASVVAFDAAARRVTASFTSESAALGAAAEVSAGLAPGSVRCGIGVGPVSSTDDMVDGPAVDDALALCTAAAAGEILCTRRVEGPLGSVEFEDRQPVQVGAPPRRVQAVVVRTGRTAAPPSLPSFLTAHDSPFVGRRADLAAIEDLWSGVRAGEGAVSVISGEPGIGKTSLVGAFARAVRAEGHWVVAGRTQPNLSVPYLPFRDALAHQVRTAVGSARRRLGRHPGELTRLLPDLTDTVRDALPPMSSDPESERHRFYEAVTSWMAALTETGPCVLVVDDIQWASSPTRDLLDHLVCSDAAGPLMVVVTCRPVGPTGGLDPASVLDMAQRRLLIELSGLDETEVAEVLHALGSPRDAAVVTERTSGNPFFVQEVARHASDDLPGGIREVIGRRVQALGVEVRDVLLSAAVLGEAFDTDVLEATVERSEAVVVAALARAEESGLLAAVPGPASRDRFVHALVRDALYEEITVRRRAAMHRRAARAVAGLHPAAYEDLARHCIAGGLTADAVRHLLAYGRRSLERLAPADAAAAFAQALDLLGDPAPADRPAQALRCDLLTGLAEAAGHTGDPTHWGLVQSAADLARRLGDPERAANALLRVTRPGLGLFGTNDPERTASLRWAVDHVEDEAIRVRAMAALLGEVVFEAVRDPSVVALADEALARARRLGDTRIVAEILARRTFMYTQEPDILARGDRETEELVALAAGIDDPALQFAAVTQRMLHLNVLGRIGEADDLLAGHLDLAEATGQSFARGHALYYRATRARARGRLDEAEGMAQQAYDTQVAGGVPDAFLAKMFTDLSQRFERGDIAALADALDPALDPSGVVLPLKAIALFEAGRLEEARMIVSSLGPGFDQPGGPTIVAVTAYVVGLVGDAHLAGRMVDGLRANADAVHWSAFAFLGHLGHHVATVERVLGLHDPAERRLRDLAEWYADADLVIWGARAHLDRGRTLLRRDAPGDEARAASALDEARRIGEDLQLAWIGEQADRIAAGDDPVWSVNHRR